MAGAGCATTAGLPERGIPKSVQAEMDAAWATYNDHAAEAPRRAAAAETYLRLNGAALDTFTLSEADRFALQVRRQEATRDLQAYHLGRRLAECDRKIHAAGRFTEAIALCGNAMDDLGRMAADPCWNEEDRAFFRNLNTEWLKRKSGESNEFETCIAGVRAKWDGWQKEFCTRRALEDKTSAGDLYEQQQRKRFNWKWLGYPRDNYELLCLAVQRLERPMGDSQVDCIVREYSGQLREKVLARFNTRERQVCKERAPLPPYRELTGYPARSDGEIREEADLMRVGLRNMPSANPEERALKAKVKAGLVSVNN
jgi:hypothetical protein